MSTTRQIKDVGVREFRDHATKYLSGSDTLAIRKNGHLIGVYVPIKRDEEQVRREFGDTLDRILQESRLTEDELADRFGLYKPRKRDEMKARQAVEQFGRTMQQLREETGMTEDEFADLFDLNKPFEE